MSRQPPRPQIRCQRWPSRSFTRKPIRQAVAISIVQRTKSPRQTMWKNWRNRQSMHAGIITEMSPGKDSLSFTLLNELLPAAPTKAQRRQLQIVEAAIGCYASVGFEKATFEKIASVCKVSRPLIQHYFPDREKLLLV